jgi:hypothetical protein
MPAAARPGCAPCDFFAGFASNFYRANFVLPGFPFAGLRFKLPPVLDFSLEPDPD